MMHKARSDESLANEMRAWALAYMRAAWATEDREAPLAAWVDFVRGREQGAEVIRLVAKNDAAGGLGQQAVRESMDDCPGTDAKILPFRRPA